MSHRSYKTAELRIMKDFQELQAEQASWCSARLMDEDSVFVWCATVKGPEDTPYAGGSFKLTIYFPVAYPFEPPTVRFCTKVFHPNISEAGNICLDVLREAWSPTFTASKVLLFIRSLLTNPNPLDPLVEDVGALYLFDYPKFVQKAREYTIQYAMEQAMEQE